MKWSNECILHNYVVGSFLATKIFKFLTISIFQHPNFQSIHNVSTFNSVTLLPQNPNNIQNKNFLNILGYKLQHQYFPSIKHTVFTYQCRNSCTLYDYVQLSQYMCNTTLVANASGAVPTATTHIRHQLLQSLPCIFIVRLCIHFLKSYFNFYGILKTWNISTTSTPETDFWNHEHFQFVITVKSVANFKI